MNFKTFDTARSAPNYMNTYFQVNGNGWGNINERNTRTQLNSTTNIDWVRLLDQYKHFVYGYLIWNIGFYCQFSDSNFQMHAIWMDKFLLQSLCLVLCFTHEILDERKYSFNINVIFWVCWTNIDVVKSMKKKQQIRYENTAPELKTNKETPKMHFNLPNLSDSVRHRLSTPANPDTICYYRWLFFPRMCQSQTMLPSC